jgi:hypothetical protein
MAAGGSEVPWRSGAGGQSSSGNYEATWQPTCDQDLADYVLTRLEMQRKRFSRFAGQARTCYISFKVVQVVLAAAIPVASSNSAPAPVTGSLGAAVVVLEGLQQLFQWHANWLRFRMAEGALRDERFDYRARIGQYGTSPDPIRLLADRVAALIATDRAGWARTSGATGKGEGGEKQGAERS